MVVHTSKTWTIHSSQFHRLELNAIIIKVWVTQIFWLGLPTFYLTKTLTNVITVARPFLYTIA